MDQKFEHVLVGGTFDRFHLGHEKLLTTAFAQSAHVSIGIATNELFKNKNLARLIQDYQEREQSVSDFLKEKGFTNRAEIVPIDDFYGTSITNEYLDAIFITESNRENVNKMNEAREEKGFHPLEIVTVPYVSGNDGEIISSERIRKGLMDRQGNSYSKLFMTQSQFQLPEKERDALRHPIGDIFTDMQQVVAAYDTQTMYIAVGDIVADSLAQIGRKAAVSVIDGRTRRHVLDHDTSKAFFGTEQRATDNPAGIITQEAAKCLAAAMSDYETTHAEQLIVVSGEEDLLAIPAILLSPLDAVVVYGQFDKGIVVVHVSEQNKKRVQDFFRKFQ